METSRNLDEKKHVGLLVRLLDNMKNRPQYHLLLAVVTLILDQVTKYWAVKRLSCGSITVIEGILDLNYVQNTGAAFGILQGNQWFFLITIPIIVLAVIIYASTKLGKEPFILVSMGLIVGGAISNYIDRIRLGYVVDFIDFHIWPIFNLADSAIVIGGLILSFNFVFGRKDGENSKGTSSRD